MTEPVPQGLLSLVFPENRSKVRIALDSFAKGAGLETETFPDLTSLAMALESRERLAVLFSLKDAPPQELESFLQVLRNLPYGASCRVLAFDEEWEQMRVRLKARMAGCDDVLSLPPSTPQLEKALGFPATGPLPETPEGSDLPTPSPRAGGTGSEAPRQPILIADDAPVIRVGLKHILKEMDLPVLEADNGNEAYRLSLATPPRLLLTDLVMPGMDGFSLISRFRGTPSNAKTPIIVISSYGDRARLVKALRSGANDFIVKPFRPEVVKEKVRRHLGDEGAEQEA